MQNVEEISKKINNTYWIGHEHDVVYGIYLWSLIPFTNTDYPYQLVFRFYNAGYKYQADTMQLQGGLGMNGQFTYGNGLNGRLVNDNKIVWSNGSEWNRIEKLPPVTTVDQYSTKYINELDDYQTTFMNDTMNKTYPRDGNYGGFDFGQF